MGRGLLDLGRFSTVPASLNLLILVMSHIVDLGCCYTLAMSDIFSPFLNRSTSTFFKSADIFFPFRSMIFGIQKHAQTRSRRHCHVCSTDVTTHYFIYRNHGFPLTTIYIFHITDAIFHEYFWPATVYVNADIIRWIICVVGLFVLVGWVYYWVVCVGGMYVLLGFYVVGLCVLFDCVCCKVMLCDCLRWWVVCFVRLCM